MKSGANEYHVFFGHSLIAFTHVLGDFTSTQSILKLHYPVASIMDYNTKTVIDAAHPKTSPDHILVQGELESGAGEIELTIPEGSIQMGQAGRALRMRVGREGELREVEWESPDEPDYIKDIPFPGTNSARLFEEFAKGGASAYADFEQGLKSKKLLDKIVKDAKYI
ncbi:hypothetical protein NQ176_g8505 [Zarea fungicola]|uniref:Uncharacterized protein n=1 Tax=Zarea fungicola TaxID=93591 RepID=A0ACC1MRW1_9HYPO|nr:hypothetical protein NQ176_g8505 [Lecanicillium fungicola]